RNSGPGQFARKLASMKHVAEFGLAIYGKTGVAALRLQIVEVQASSAVRVRRSIDDASRRGSKQPVAQDFSEYKVRHVVRREGSLQAVGRDASLAEQGARVIDEHIDARLGGSDLVPHAFHFGEAREIGIERAMRSVRTCREALQLSFGACTITS